MRATVLTYGIRYSACEARAYSKRAALFAQLYLDFYSNYTRIMNTLVRRRYGQRESSDCEPGQMASNDNVNDDDAMPIIT